jgi:hypothetical protein
LEMLAGGRLHLSAVCLLAPHLTEENHPSLLEAAVHRSKRRVELLMAERFPKPDVPQSIRKLPAPQPEMAVPSPIAIAARPAEPSIPPAHVPAVPAAAPAPPPRPAVVVPLAPERFKLQLTISRKTRERLETALPGPREAGVPPYRPAGQGRSAHAVQRHASLQSTQWVRGRGGLRCRGGGAAHRRGAPEQASTSTRPGDSAGARAVRRGGIAQLIRCRAWRASLPRANRRSTP